MIIQKKCLLDIQGKATWIDFIYSDDYTWASAKVDELEKLDPSSTYRLVDVIW